MRSKNRKLSRTAVTIATVALIGSVSYWANNGRLNHSPQIARGGGEDNERKLDIIERFSTPLIGEDCACPYTACGYFRPHQFLKNHPEFKDYTDNFCSLRRDHTNAIGVVDCDEEEEDSNGGKYCRPAAAANKETLVGNKLMNLPKKFSFKWVRKTGGNTFMEAFLALRWTVPLFEHEPYLGFGGARKDETLHKVSERMKLIAQEQEAQRQGDGYGHPLVAIVRNPVSRFISSVSMLLTIEGNEIYREECFVEGDNTETLRCVMNLVEDGLLDDHVVPMFADIYCNTFGEDVEMSLYPMTMVPKLLESLSFDSKREANKAKSGFSVGDLDEELIERVCRFYKVDVDMMEKAGFPVPECKFVGLTENT